MAKEKGIEITDINKMSEEDKVKTAFTLFEMYFSKSYKLLEGKTFITLDQFKEYLMIFKTELIEEETFDLLKQFIMILTRNGFSEETKSLKIGTDTPQERFNCYKYASHMIATNMIEGNIN